MMVGASSFLVFITYNLFFPEQFKTKHCFFESQGQTFFNEYFSPLPKKIKLKPPLESCQQLRRGGDWSE